MQITASEHRKVKVIPLSPSALLNTLKFSASVFSFTNISAIREKTLQADTPVCEFSAKTGS